MTRALVVWLCAVSIFAAAASAVDLTEDERSLLGAPQGTALEGRELEVRTEEIAGLMRCPVCQGLSIADSHTPVALAMRGKIERLLAAGYSQEQILQYFEASYGEFIRLAPKPEGFNLVVWIAPLVALLLGAWLVARRVGRGRAAAAEPELEAYRRRVREEMNR